jgi:glutathione S-transferase
VTVESVDPVPVLVIGNKNYSSWSLRPWLLLRHHDVAFREVRLCLDTPEFAGLVAAWSDAGRVPVLQAGDLRVWDSLAICEYANEQWLGGTGWPSAAPARAQARSAAAEMHSGFAALRGQLPFNCRRVPDGYRGDAEVRADVMRVQALWRYLRERHGKDGDFLCGRFGIVDAMFAPVCLRFRSYGIEVDEDARHYMRAILALPALLEWLSAAEAEAESLPETDNAGR